MKTHVLYVIKIPALFSCWASEMFCGLVFSVLSLFTAVGSVWPVLSLILEPEGSSSSPKSYRRTMESWQREKVLLPCVYSQYCDLYMGHVDVKRDIKPLCSSVVVLCSGSAPCLLWKPPKGPLCHHTTCFTGTPGVGESGLDFLSWQYPQHPVRRKRTLANHKKLQRSKRSYYLCVRVSFQTKCQTLPPGSAVSMLRSLFQDVHVQVRLTCAYISDLSRYFVKHT